MDYYSRTIAVCLFLAVLLIRINGTKDKQPITAALDAAHFLLSNADSNYDWRDFTPRALTAVSFVKDYFEIPKEEQKKMVSSLERWLLDLLKDGVTKVPLHVLALSINALYALCEDPRSFRGDIDLVEFLRFQTDKAMKADFHSPIVLLSLCIGKDTRREDFDHLIKIYDDKRNVRIGFKALTLVAAASCDSQATTQHHYDLEDRAMAFIRRHRADVSTDAYTKALIAQVHNAWGSNFSSSLRDELLGLQEENGSIGGFLGTYAAIPAIMGKSLADLQCKTRNYAAKSRRTSLATSDTMTQVNQVHYSLSIPYGDNVGYHSLVLAFEGRLSFHDLMNIAAEKNSLYRFTVEELEGIGKKTNHLAGITNDIESSMTWMLYRKTGQDMVEENSGVDWIYPQDGDHFLYQLEQK